MSIRNDLLNQFIMQDIININKTKTAKSYLYD